MQRPSRTSEEELANFLACQFNQDMGSTDQALAEYIQEEISECILQIIESAELFLSSNRPDQEKEHFIKSNTEIYFPAIGMKPIEFLQSVVTQLKEAVSHKD